MASYMTAQNMYYRLEYLRKKADEIKRPVHESVDESGLRMERGSSVNFRYCCPIAISHMSHPPFSLVLERQKQNMGDDFIVESISLTGPEQIDIHHVGHGEKVLVGSGAHCDFRLNDPEMPEECFTLIFGEDDRVRIQVENATIWVKPLVDQQ